MSARMVAILLAVALFSFFAGWILAWFLEPLKATVVRWWQARDLRRHRGDFWLWEKGETTEVDHE